MSWNKAYALFPQQILVRRELSLVNLGYYSLYSDYTSSLKELIKQGWTHRDDFSDDLFPSLGRLVDDTKSCIIPFDTTGIAHSERPDNVLEASNFALRDPAQDPWEEYQRAVYHRSWSFPPEESTETLDVHPSHTFLICQVAQFSHPVLKYRYTISAYNCQWAEFLQRRCNGEFWERLDEVPHQIRNKVRSYLSRPGSINRCEELWDIFRNSGRRWLDWRYVDGRVGSWMKRFLVLQRLDSLTEALVPRPA